MINYNSNWEGLENLRWLNISGKARLSRNDSHVNRFKSHHFSSYVIPFRRVKYWSHLEELAYVLSPIFIYIRCLVDLILEINVMPHWLISKLLFYRSNLKWFYLLKKTGVINFILFTHLLKSVLLGSVSRSSFSFLV